MTIITEDLAIKVDEIVRLVGEATEHALQFDGHCKSSEGCVEISIPPFSWREGEDRTPSVAVYSYVLGPNRMHYFKNVDEALAEVRKWHAKEMAQDYNGAGWGF